MKFYPSFSMGTLQGRGESFKYSDFSGHAREKLSKEHPILIDLTKPQRYQLFSGKHIEVRRDREAVPYTASKFLMTTMLAVFWVVMPCSLVKVYRCFRGTSCPRHQGYGAVLLAACCQHLLT
jgi:hypothetical protein